MKNILISGLILGIVMFPVAPIRAQVAAAPVEDPQVTALTIQMLILQIEILKAQIEEILARQTTTEQTIGAVSTQVEEISPVISQATVMVKGVSCEKTSGGNWYYKIDMETGGAWKSGSMLVNYSHVTQKRNIKKADRFTTTPNFLVASEASVDKTKPVTYEVRLYSNLFAISGGSLFTGDGVVATAKGEITNLPVCQE